LKDHDAAATEAERRRLRWRCRRGMRELDVLLERWLDRYWDEADRAHRAAFERLLANEDDALWAWVTGRSSPEDVELVTLVEQLVAPAGGRDRRPDG